MVKYSEKVPIDYANFGTIFRFMKESDKKKILKQLAEGYSVTERKTITRYLSDGETIDYVICEETEKFVPPNLQALDLLNEGNPRRFSTK